MLFLPFVFFGRVSVHSVAGGAYENRIRFPVEIVRQIRERVGPDFIIIFRLSMLDLVEKGSTWEEIVKA